MRKVSEAIPLRPGLRVQMVEIVVCDAFEQSLDLMLEGLATEGWLVGDVERKIDGHDFAGANFFGCGGYAGRGKEVETPNLVFVSKSKLVLEIGTVRSRLSPKSRQLPLALLEYREARFW